MRGTPHHATATAAAQTLAAPAAPGADALASSEFARELRAGLARPARGISPKFFYDARGSALFDDICGLPEYYPTRTELRILADSAAEIAAHIGPLALIIRFRRSVMKK